jgi:GNAT superfamily N-acetyltransferase
VISYQREQVGDVIEEIKPLLALHWREIAHYQDIALDPDWEFYRRAPAVRVYTARLDGELIGYGVFFLAPNRHYKQSIQAVQDILFLHPDHRGGRTGYRLIKFCDEQAKAEGAQAIYHHVKSAHDFGPLLGALGYELVDLIYAKRLDKE